MASSVINSVNSFQQILLNAPGSMIHCAVQRTRYKHHYIALGNTFCDNCNTCDIIHFAKDSWWWNGSVKQVNHYHIQIDINRGLYVYQNDDYPRNDGDFSSAKDRFEKLQNASRGYSVSLNNCEHVVNYILTGHAVSYQLRDASIFQRFFLDLIDLFTEGLCKNFLAAVVNGLAPPLFMFGFLYYYYLQIKVLLDTESRDLSGFEKIKRSAVSWFGRIFKNSGNKISPVEQRFLDTLNQQCLLILDPKKVIDSANAKALLEKAAHRLPSFTIATTGILTFIVEGLFSISNVRSLRRDLRDNFINIEDFKRHLLNAILFVLRVILTSFIISRLFSNDKKHFFRPIWAFLCGFIGNFASRFFVTCIMEVFCRLYRYLNNPRNGLNQQEETHI